MYFIPIVVSLFGLAAAVAWGLADFFAAKASKKYSPEITFLAGSLLGAILFSVIFILSRGSIHWNTPGVIYSAVAGVFFSIGYMAFYRGLTIGPISIVSPVGSAYPIITLLFVLLIFHASLTGLEIGGILVTVLGIIIASEVKYRKGQKAISPGFKLALITLFFWGIGFALFGRSVNYIGWQKATFIDYWASAIFYWVWCAWTEGQPLMSRLKLKHFFNPYVAGNELLLLAGWVVFAYGLSRSHTSAIITAVSAIYPALTVFLSIKYLGEKRKLIPIVGAVITLAGVIILSV